MFLFPSMYCGVYLFNWHVLYVLEVSFDSILIFVELEIWSYTNLGNFEIARHMSTINLY